MAAARELREIGPSPFYRVAWTTTPANYDILANDGAKGPVHGGRPCRSIIIGVAGTLVVTGLDGVNVTLPSGPTEWPIQAIALVSSSTAQQVTVLW